MTFVRTSLPKGVPIGNERSAGDTRLVWVDAVKGLGIFLMFYGHFLQKGVAPDNAAARDQLRLIYSFHMPLFFVLSGLFYRGHDDVHRRLRQLVVRRLVPVAFFGVLLSPLWAMSEIKQHLPLWHDAALVGGEYLRGRPTLDWVTWFLVCLFVAELLAMATLRYIQSPIGRTTFGLACIWLGVFFCSHSDVPAHGLAYLIGRTWFFSESIVALGFYAIGAAAYPLLQKLSAQRLQAFVVLALGGTVVVTTFRLNHPLAAAVMMAAREHGNPFEFALTAFAGTAAMVALGILCSGFDWLRLLGRNALPLLGLNGLFFHYVAPKLSHVKQVPSSMGLVVGEMFLVTVMSLVACAPLVYLLNRYLPQLVGRPQETGPWLPSLEGPRKPRDTEELQPRRTAW